MNIFRRCFGFLAGFDALKADIDTFPCLSLQGRQPLALALSFHVESFLYIVSDSLLRVLFYISQHH